MFVLPAIVIVIALFIYPICSSIVYSFTNKNLIKPAYKFIGFKNYAEVLRDSGFWLSFFTALALKRIKVCKGVYKTLLIIPWAFPSIVIAFSWKWILNGVYGFLPNILVKLGICEAAPQFLTSGTLAFVSLVLINIWFGAPMIMVNVLSALETVPKDQYEAAQIDGARPWQSFYYVTVPHIKMVVGLLVVLRTVWIFNNFDLIYLITGGGPAGTTQTIPLYAYNMGWSTKLIGRSSAVTVLLFIFLMIICGIYFAVINKWEKEDSK